MGLETATYVNDLVDTNPDGSDQRSQGDNHLRLIKTVLRNTFPGMAGRMSRAQSKGGNYTAVLNDNTSLLFFTAAATLSLTAVATLGNGWSVMIYAGGGDVTVDPNGAEEVNGAATKVVKQGQMAILMSTGIAGDEFVMLYVPSTAEMTAAAWTTGDVKATYKVAADSGWIMANDGSIGSAGSGATNRANADTEPLYTLFWNNIADADAPVSGGRGASAAADFGANKPMTIPKALGRSLASAGAGSGLTSRALGSALGTETKTIVEGNLPSHAHSVPSLSVSGSITSFSQDQITDSGTLRAITFATNVALGGGAAAISGVAGTVSGSTGTGTTGSVGSSSALDVMNPRFHTNFMIKL